jgi:ATP-dependent Lon protease
MSDKQSISKKDIKKPNQDIVVLIERKMTFFQDTIQRTILHVQKNKMLDVITVSDLNNCINTLFELSKSIKDITEKEINSNTDNVINSLQYINNELSLLFKVFGTELFEDFLWVCFGNNSVNTYAISDMDKHKFELLKKYFHPTSYRILAAKKPEATNKFDDNLLTEKSKNLDCADLSIKVKSFYSKVYGIQLIVHNPQHKKSLIISGIVDDIMVEFLNNKFVNLKMNAIRENIPNSLEFKGDVFGRFINSLGLKDYLIYEPHEIYSKYAGCLSNLNTIKQKTIAQTVKDFISSELFAKRLMLIQLLIKPDKYDNQYLAYLLYDLMSNDVNGLVDTQEQVTIFDSFPWSIKQYFRDAMKKTIQYTNDLANFDIQKIPLEQQICLLKAPDLVKEKAMQKLKEVKAKSEDSGSKARQFLDGLLKIPFNIYKKEPILNLMDDIRGQFKELIQVPHNNIYNFELKEKYTSLEILKCLKQLKGQPHVSPDIELIKSKLNECDKNALLIYILKVNDLIVKHKLSIPKIKQSNKKKHDLISSIVGFIDDIMKDVSNIDLINELFVSMKIKNDENNGELIEPIKKIEDKYNEINNYMSNVKITLDKAVHGHDKAKKQIERIIGQWINGQQDGYCFGFEGPPGTGKTSLAKRGLSECLKDEYGQSRPFAMIQMGGDANGSSLHGHNYTYVGSTWGQIVQILMDKKCMNPIIFIDEIDKISKTEHGKEIIGILTHLLDPAQNDVFQDKYFSGIDLDLSKALFILSYNDVDSIDKILLDRIHRIKFKNLTLEEKITISNIHILPEVYKKMGLTGMIQISDETLKYIIDNYTLEPGVRKLKEILFEIVGELNLDILKNFNTQYEIPIKITIDDIKTKFFKDKQETKVQKIHNESKVGIINGLWANALGMGGIIPIQAKWRPSDKAMSLHLTGTQGDVMKESMSVALTLAWSLTPLDIRTKILEENVNKLNGIHIHCPDGSTPKDGPSAGTAITTTIYSLFNNKKIKNTIAITGEITLDGNMTAIGGLDLKILGGIKAGIKEFIYPKENEKDFNSFMVKYKDDELTKGITFYSLDHIDQVFSKVFE